MTKEIKNTVLQIDAAIRKHKWFDFQVLSYDSTKLIVAGGTDLIYFHELEIIFEDIFFVQGFFNGWHSNTNEKVFFLPENEIELNKKYEIEIGYQLFIFKTEDYKLDVIIAAKNITYTTNTVN